MTRALVLAALLLVIVALTRRTTNPRLTAPRLVVECPDLSELSYGDLPSWPSVRVG